MEVYGSIWGTYGYMEVYEGMGGLQPGKGNGGELYHPRRYENRDISIIGVSQL